MAKEKQIRKKRFKRDLAVNVRLTERDLRIIKAVHEHRFLNSEHIAALEGSKSQALTRRLNLLYHGGYLDRPRVQLAMAGNNPMVYGLGNQGAEVLERDFGQKLPHIDWTSKNREVKIIFLEHALLVSEFLLIIRLACRERSNIEFISPKALVERKPLLKGNTNPLGWKVIIGQEYSGLSYRKELNLYPDSGFGLRLTDQDGKTRTAWFFYEADRATMPIRRRNLRQSSFYKKMVCYWESYRQLEKEGKTGKVFYENFGFRYPRILTLTTSKERIQSMIEAQKNIDLQGQGFRMFLFAPANAFQLDKPQTVLSANAWLNGQSKPTGLLK